MGLRVEAEAFVSSMKGLLEVVENLPSTWKGWHNDAQDAYQAGPFTAGNAALSQQELC